MAQALYLLQVDQASIRHFAVTEIKLDEIRVFCQRSHPLVSNFRSDQVQFRKVLNAREMVEARVCDTRTREVEQSEFRQGRDGRHRGVRDTEIANQAQFLQMQPMQTTNPCIANLGRRDIECLQLGAEVFSGTAVAVADGTAMS